MPHDQPVDSAWSAQLNAGDAEGAWDAFLGEHRRVLFGAIGALVRDQEERMDAFAHVCGRLRDNGFRRLRAFRPDGPARFTTWLVTVVRHLVVDWYRESHGRSRLDALLARRSPLQRRLFALLTGRRRSYIEAYEVLRASGEYHGRFPDFLREVRDLYKDVRDEAGPLSRELIGVDPAVELDRGPAFQPESVHDYQRALEALSEFPDDVRAATLLFVVDEVPADQVAQLVGWDGRKTVYNRVYRTLSAIRARLDSTG